MEDSLQLFIPAQPPKKVHAVTKCAAVRATQNFSSNMPLSECGER
jgi:hypothetical protein